MGCCISEEQKRENKLYGYKNINISSNGYQIVSNRTIDLILDTDKIIVSRLNFDFRDPNFPSFSNVQNTFAFEIKNHDSNLTKDYNNQLISILNFYKRNDSHCYSVVKKHFCEEKIIIDDINALETFSRISEILSSNSSVVFKFRVKITVSYNQIRRDITVEARMKLVFDSICKNNEIFIVHAVKIEDPSCPYKSF